MNEVMRREMDEAILAGERALESLKLAQGKLDSARNWGIFDIFGGDLFGTFMKHSRMQDASNYMESAKRNLKIFQKELRDVDQKIHLDVNVGGFLSFADFFFDGLVADMLVHSKINEIREQVHDAICHVESLLTELKYQREEL